jgi:hypothetical protein
MLNEDYKEKLQILLNNEVRFLIVGAYAMGAYGYPRATGDFDIWAEASPENSKEYINPFLNLAFPCLMLLKKHL